MVARITIERAPGAGTSDDSATGTCASGSEGCGLMLMRLARAANRSLALALEEAGLRAQGYAVLHRLAERGPSSQAELADVLRVHASNLVRVLDELEGKGLIARRRDPLDRRRQEVGITAEGARLLQRAESATATTERELLAPLSETERAQLQQLLGRMAAHVCAGESCAR
jgi:MarR family transcriptional regulator, lower aerobic nicotinate degradation pathway regulator